VPGQSSDATQHPHRLNVELGPFSAPGLDQPVDLIAVGLCHSTQRTATTPKLEQLWTQELAVGRRLRRLSKLTALIAGFVLVRAGTSPAEVFCHPQRLLTMASD
jgi:hypothetical protein